VIDSANTDPELRHWLRWVSEGNNTPMFVRRVPMGLPATRSRAPSNVFAGTSSTVRPIVLAIVWKLSYRETE
jgi:hypothetical protein